jgi:hypothetical protein
MYDENGLSLGCKQLFGFNYVPDEPSMQSKRKYTGDEELSQLPRAKRFGGQPLQLPKLENPSGAYLGQYMPIPGASLYASLLHPTIQRRDRRSSPYPYGSSYGQRQHEYAMSPSLAPQSLRDGSRGVINYGSYPLISQAKRPRMSPGGLGSQALSRSVSASSDPPWVRTSELRHAQSTAERLGGYGAAPSFNPYAQYPDAKAELEIAGNLLTICDDWTATEKQDNRRLVEFSRTQAGSTITATFKAVSPEERSPSQPCISCIFWSKKGQWYVTSVDTIALLEGLVAVRFTVEEKNRIRRNLEGFKPYTVSKAKDECDDVFKLIMGFPNPKPRNIEKDIKIFPWSILGNALKKVINKYVSGTFILPHYL